MPGIDFPGSEDYENANEVERRFGYKPGFCDAALHGIPQGTPCRLVPDVSAQADWETGAITVYSREYRGSGEEQSPSGWVTSGGTSSATPIWAGMLALADASPGCRANPATAGGVGFAPPLLYAIASNPTAYAASFNDITHGNNDQYNLDGGGVFPARRGFDLASGLGSPRMTGPGGTPGLAWYLCTYAGQTSRPTVTSLAPSSGPTTGGTQLTIHGTGFTAEGQPAVGGVQIGIWHASASAIEVTGPETLTVRLPAARLTLPAHAPSGQTGAGPAQVIVTTLDGQSSAPGPGSTFQYYESAAGGALPAVTGVTPYGGSEGSPEPVTILGAGFGAGDRVSFGGRAGTNVRILDPGRILVTPPAYTPATQCSPLPAAAPYAGENALNDICQVQVVVTGPGGSSQPSEILPPFEGAPSYEQDGGLRRPGGCGCEIYPAQTEYDYAPAPAISSISTSQGAQAMASEIGGSLVTIHGTGLGRFTFDYARFDSPRLEALLEIENIDASIAYITGTEIRLAAPALVEEAAQASVRPRSLGIALRTLAGETGEAPITYAGIPRVTGVTNPADPRELEGLPGITQDAGQQLVVRGQGMTGQVLQARLAAIGGGPEAASEQLGVRGPDSIEVTTSREHPALDDVRLCTVTGCSTAGHGDRVLVYPPGRPQVTSLSPDSGPAAGGTLVTIGGRNLGCPLSISFADRPAARFTAAQALEDCGPGTAPTVSSPSGSALTEVPVTVETLSSFFSGTAPSPSKARFGYGP